MAAGLPTRRVSLAQTATTALLGPTVLTVGRQPLIRFSDCISPRLRAPAQTEPGEVVEAVAVAVPEKAVWDALTAAETAGAVVVVAATGVLGGVAALGAVRVSAFCCPT